MPKVLIVSSVDLAPELGKTILWRSDIERVFAPNAHGLEAARSVLPRLVVLEETDLASALSFIKGLRGDEATRSVSLVVLSRATSLSLSEEESLRDAGANVVLAGEADPAIWDSRLEELLSVPRRLEARIPVRFEVWSHLAPEGDAVEAAAINISVRGILIESAEPLDWGTKLEVSLKLPGMATEMRVVGQVVREEETSDGRFRSGIEFLIPRGEALDTIRAFVESETRR